jgi:hypothetical protein
MADAIANLPLPIGPLFVGSGRKAVALGLDTGRDLGAGKTDILLRKEGLASGKGTTFPKPVDKPGGSSSFSPAISLLDSEAT